MGLRARVNYHRGLQPLRGYIFVGLLVPLGQGIKDQELAVPLRRNRQKLSFDAARFGIDKGRADRDIPHTRIAG
jgi:hypothetical protein